MIRINFIILNFIAGKVFAANLGIDIGSTMCNLDEDVYISCTFPRIEKNQAEKVASVCAKNNLSPNEGYVQYRYGVPEQSPEFVYPKKKVPPRDVFELHTGVGANSEAERSLQFYNGGYLYSFERKGLEGYWLVVKNAKKTVFRKHCDEPGKAYLSDRVSQGIGGKSLKLIGKESRD